MRVPSNDINTLLILYLTAGVLLVGLALPLFHEKIRPNPFYGFRFPRTLQDPEVWYATNKFAAKRLIWAGISLILASAGLYFVPGITLDQYVLGCLLIFAAVFTLGLVQSVKYMQSL